MTTAVLIGSYEGMPAQTWSVTANAVTENVTIPAGSYYVHDTNAALSLCTRVATALNTHSQLAAALCFLNSAGRVRIVSGTALSINFTDTVARDMLGYTGNLASSTNHLAPGISRRVWIPGKDESPEDAIKGVHGRRIKDTRVGMSGLGGRVVATHNDTRIVNAFWWRHILASRYWTTTEAGGEWQTFWDVVVSNFLRFKLYRNVVEGDGSVAMGFPSGFIGPYKLRTDGIVDFDVNREITNVERMYRVDLPVVLVEEYA